MLTGRGLGVLAPMLMADANGRGAYAEMARSPAFLHPGRHAEQSLEEFDGLLLPGGHAPGMKPYLESRELQALVAATFEQGKPVDTVTAADLGVGPVGWAGAGQEITDVTAAEARKAGEIVEDDGDGHLRVIQFLETLKVI